METKAVLFDLDGTLLPMDQERFTKTYFQLLAAKLAPLGYDPAKLVDSIWAGTAAMVKNDGSCTNEEAFWRVVSQIYGEASLKDKPYMDTFYAEEFNQAKPWSSPQIQFSLRWPPRTVSAGQDFSRSLSACIPPMKTPIIASRT